MPDIVMPGLDPGIQFFWIAGHGREAHLGPAMTIQEEALESNIPCRQNAQTTIKKQGD